MWPWTGTAKLLDVGAGDGNVTRRLAPLFDDITVTEASKYMGNRLRGRGYRCVRVGHAACAAGPRGSLNSAALGRAVWWRTLT